jgi:hypothetical protein
VFSLIVITHIFTVRTIWRMSSLHNVATTLFTDLIEWIAHAFTLS